MVVFFTIFFTVYTALNYYVFIRGWQALASYSYLRPYYIVVFVIVAYGYVFSKLLYKILPPLVYDIWLGVGAIWFAFLVYFILTLLLIDIVRLIDSWFHFLPASIHNNYEQTKKITALVVIAAVSLIVFLGNLNKRDITVKDWVIRDELRRGDLVEVMTDWSCDDPAIGGVPVYVVYAQTAGTAPPLKSRVFVELVKDLFAREGLAPRKAR